MTEHSCIQEVDHARTGFLLPQRKGGATGGVQQALIHLLVSSRGVQLGCYLGALIKGHSCATQRYVYIIVQDMPAIEAWQAFRDRLADVTWVEY